MPVKKRKKIGISSRLADAYHCADQLNDDDKLSSRNYEIVRSLKRALDGIAKCIAESKKL